MADYPRYSIGKPGIDDDRSWADMRQTLRRSEVEKIELSVGADIPEARKQKARETTDAIHGNT